MLTCMVRQLDHHSFGWCLHQLWWVLFLWGAFQSRQILDLLVGWRHPLVLILLKTLSLVLGLMGLRARRIILSHPYLWLADLSNGTSHFLGILLQNLGEGLTLDIAHQRIEFIPLTVLVLTYLRLRLNTYLLLLGKLLLGWFSQRLFSGAIWFLLSVCNQIFLFWFLAAAPLMVQRPKCHFNLRRPLFLRSLLRYFSRRVRIRLILSLLSHCLELDITCAPRFIVSYFKLVLTCELHLLIDHCVMILMLACRWGAT